MVDVTIVIFYAFNRLNTEVFYKGESLERIEMHLYSICSTYIVCELLQGQMQQIEIEKLTNFRLTK